MLLQEKRASSSTASAFDTSHWNPRASTPSARISAATDSARSNCTSATTTPEAPALARASAIPRPIPLPPPVTTAPVLIMSISCLLWLRAHDERMLGIRFPAQPYRLRVDPLLERLRAAFATQATALVAAERGGGAA